MPDGSVSVITAGGHVSLDEVRQQLKNCLGFPWSGWLFSLKGIPLEGTSPLGDIGLRTGGRLQLNTIQSPNNSRVRTKEPDSPFQGKEDQDKNSGGGPEPAGMPPKSTTGRVTVIRDDLAGQGTIAQDRDLQKRVLVTNPVVVVAEGTIIEDPREGGNKAGARSDARRPRRQSVINTHTECPAQITVRKRAALEPPTSAENRNPPRGPRGCDVPTPQGSAWGQTRPR